MTCMTCHEMSWHIMINEAIFSPNVMKCHEMSRNIIRCLHLSWNVFQFNMVTFDDMSWHCHNVFNLIQRGIQYVKSHLVSLYYFSWGSLTIFHRKGWKWWKYRTFDISTSKHVKSWLLQVLWEYSQHPAPKLFPYFMRSKRLSHLIVVHRPCISCFAGA